MRKFGSLKSKLPLIALLYLVAVLSGAWGFAAGRYGVFPTAFLELWWLAELEAFLKGDHAAGKRRRGGTTGVLDRIMRHRQELLRRDIPGFRGLTGFERVDGVFTDAGYLLMSRFSGRHKQVVVELVRLKDFKVLHSWLPPLDDILAHSPVDRHRNSHEGYCAKHPLLLEGGSVVFTSGQGPLVRIDRDSKIEWIIKRHFHHSIEWNHEGNLVVTIVIEGESSRLPAKYRDDGYAVVSPGGEILSEFSVADILIDNGYEGLLLGVGTFEQDRIHLNDAQPIHRNVGGAKVGDVALSCRHISAVLLYRPSSNKVVWLKTGPWLNQHDINLLDDGSWSIFGNDVIRLIGDLVPRSGISEVYVFDADRNVVRKPFTDVLRKIKGLSETEGRSRILENGDVFVELTDKRALFRLSKDGVRWAFVNGLSAKTVGALHWSRYYRADELDLSWLPEGSVSAYEDSL